MNSDSPFTSQSGEVFRHPHHNLPEEGGPRSELIHETVDVSSAFLPDSGLNTVKPDLILLSKDGVQFYVHSVVFQSKQAFETLTAHVEPNTDAPPVVNIDEPKDTVNILLHTIYGLSSAAFGHDFQEISSAVDRLPVYGVIPKDILIPSHPMYKHLLYNAPLYPLPTYALAAHHGIESLAIASSSHLLTLPLSAIPDSLAERMGAIYLKRLFLLHHQRAQDLRALLSNPFRPHPLSRDCRCSFEEQKSIALAWSLTSSYLLWDVQSNISPQTLESTLLSLESNIDCAMCHANLREKVQTVVRGWSLTKQNTI